MVWFPVIGRREGTRGIYGISGCGLGLCRVRATARVGENDRGYEPPRPAYLYLAGPCCPLGLIDLVPLTVVRSTYRWPCHISSTTLQPLAVVSHTLCRASRHSSGRLLCGTSKWSMEIIQEEGMGYLAGPGPRQLLKRDLP